jgi:dTDP-4-amino-4,6-dideoxygalactose transaminase
MKITYGHPNIKPSDELMTKIKEVLDSGWVSIGLYVEDLECHFKEKFHVKHAIACSSATTGLIIAVKAAGWKNLKVALPAFTWPSTLYALECNGNQPMFLDINTETWLAESRGYDHERENKLIMVDTFGNQSRFKNYPKKDTIIDAAHSYGAPDLGKRGIAEVVSLSFTKIVTATEGGMILTDDDELADTATELRRLSGRMEEINALIALESIEMYGFNEDHDRMNYYEKHIVIPYKRQLQLNWHTHSVFNLLFDNRLVRDTIRLALMEKGVETKVYYDPLCSGLPNTDYVYDRILSLPVHEGIIGHQDEIIEIVNTKGRSARTPGKDYLTK